MDIKYEVFDEELEEVVLEGKDAADQPLDGEIDRWTLLERRLENFRRKEGPVAEGRRYRSRRLTPEDEDGILTPEDKSRGLGMSEEGRTNSLCGESMRDEIWRTQPEYSVREYKDRRSPSGRSTTEDDRRRSRGRRFTPEDVRRHSLSRHSTTPSRYLSVDNEIWRSRSRYSSPDDKRRRSRSRESTPDKYRHTSSRRSTQWTQRRESPSRQSTTVDKTLRERSRFSSPEDERRNLRGGESTRVDERRRSGPSSPEKRRRRSRSTTPNDGADFERGSRASAEHQISRDMKSNREIFQRVRNFGHRYDGEDAAAVAEDSDAEINEETNSCRKRKVGVATIGEKRRKRNDDDDRQRNRASLTSKSPSLIDYPSTYLSSQVDGNEENETASFFESREDGTERTEPASITGVDDLEIIVPPLLSLEAFCDPAVKGLPPSTPPPQRLRLFGEIMLGVKISPLPLFQHEAIVASSLSTAGTVPRKRVDFRPEADVCVFDLFVDRVRCATGKGVDAAAAERAGFERLAEKLRSSDYVKIERESGEERLGLYSRYSEAPAASFRYDLLCGERKVSRKDLPRCSSCGVEGHLYNFCVGWQMEHSVAETPPLFAMDDEAIEVCGREKKEFVRAGNDSRLTPTDPIIQSTDHSSTPNPRSPIDQDSVIVDSRKRRLRFNAEDYYSDIPYPYNDPIASSADNFENNTIKRDERKRGGFDDEDVMRERDKLRKPIVSSHAHKDDSLPKFQTKSPSARYKSPSPLPKSPSPLPKSHSPLPKSISSIPKSLSSRHKSPSPFPTAKEKLMLGIVSTLKRLLLSSSSPCSKYGDYENAENLFYEAVSRHDGCVQLRMDKNHFEMLVDDILVHQRKYEDGHRGSNKASFFEELIDKLNLCRFLKIFAGDRNVLMLSKTAVKENVVFYKCDDEIVDSRSVGEDRASIPAPNRSDDLQHFSEIASRSARAATNDDSPRVVGGNNSDQTANRLMGDVLISKKTDGKKTVGESMATTKELELTKTVFSRAVKDSSCGLISVTKKLPPGNELMKNLASKHDLKNQMSPKESSSQESGSGSVTTQAKNVQETGTIELVDLPSDDFTLNFSKLMRSIKETFSHLPRNEKNELTMIIIKKHYKPETVCNMFETILSKNNMIVSSAIDSMNPRKNAWKFIIKDQRTLTNIYNSTIYGNYKLKQKTLVRFYLNTICRFMAANGEKTVGESIAFIKELELPKTVFSQAVKDSSCELISDTKKLPPGNELIKNLASKHDLENQMSPRESSQESGCGSVTARAKNVQETGTIEPEDLPSDDLTLNFAKLMRSIKETFSHLLSKKKKKLSITDIKQKYKPETLHNMFETILSKNNMIVCSAIDSMDPKKNAWKFTIKDQRTLTNVYISTVYAVKKQKPVVRFYMITICRFMTANYMRIKNVENEKILELFPEKQVTLCYGYDVLCKHLDLMNNTYRLHPENKNGVMTVGEQSSAITVTEYSFANLMHLIKNSFQLLYDFTKTDKCHENMVESLYGKEKIANEFEKILTNSKMVLNTTFENNIWLFSINNVLVFCTSIVQFPDALNQFYQQIIYDIVRSDYLKLVTVNNVQLILKLFETEKDALHGSKRYDLLCKSYLISKKDGQSLKAKDDQSLKAKDGQSLKTKPNENRSSHSIKVPEKEQQSKFKKQSEKKQSNQLSVSVSKEAVEGNIFKNNQGDRKPEKNISEKSLELINLGLKSTRLQLFPLHPENTNAVSVVGDDNTIFSATVPERRFAKLMQLVKNTFAFLHNLPKILNRYESLISCRCNKDDLASIFKELLENNQMTLSTINENYLWKFKIDNILVFISKKAFNNAFIQFHRRFICKIVLSDYLKLDMVNNEQIFKIFETEKEAMKGSYRYDCLCNNDQDRAHASTENKQKELEIEVQLKNTKHPVESNQTLTPAAASHSHNPQQKLQCRWKDSRSKNYFEDFSEKNSKTDKNTAGRTTNSQNLLEIGLQSFRSFPLHPENFEGAHIVGQQDDASNLATDNEKAFAKFMQTVKNTFAFLYNIPKFLSSYESILGQKCTKQELGGIFQEILRHHEMVLTSYHFGNFWHFKVNDIIILSSKKGAFHDAQNQCFRRTICLIVLSDYLKLDTINGQCTLLLFETAKQASEGSYRYDALCNKI